VTLTDDQRQVVEWGSGPCRVIGTAGTGKTTTLQARARRLATAVDPERLLVIVRDGETAQRWTSASGIGVAATSFQRLALDIVGRARGPVRLLSPDEQRAVVGTVLVGEGRSEWPTLWEHLADGAFVDELARVVLHYQASSLRPDELRARAEAAGAPERWDELASFSSRYLCTLAEQGAVDSAGALAQASLALDDPAVAEAERARFDHVLVDDYEAVSSPAARLLRQLAPAGANVSVAGNPDAAIGSRSGASPRHLQRFDRDFQAGLDLRFTRPFRRPAAPRLRICLSDEEEHLAVVDTLAAGSAAGVGSAGMAVLARQPASAEEMAAVLDERHIRVARSGRPGVTVCTIDAAAGLEWAVVVVAGCREGLLPAPPEPWRWFDPSVLGSDFPVAREGVERTVAEERRRFAVACSRATRRLVLTATLPVTRFVADLVLS
jgi:superfamily I DNA/RNA helicase